MGRKFFRRAWTVAGALFVLVEVAAHWWLAFAIAALLVIAMLVAPKTEK